MTTGSTRPATPADRSRLVGVLASAFVTDPVVTWLVGAQRTDQRRLTAFFQTMVPRRLLAAGTCDVSDGGAAVWYGPGQYRPDPPLRTLLALPGLVTAFGPRLRAAGEADTAMRALHPHEPHWYLQFLGVRPEQAGRGTGSALLQSRLAHIDATGTAAYLETATPRNLPLYERHGFEVVREERLAPDAPPEWLMWRPARPPAG